MTVLHSRNADAADPADVADAADVKDPQDAAAEPDLREDLGRYADLGAFTLTADTHAWYAALDTVATPEDARAASSALAELRGRDLTQTWEAVTALAADAKLAEPDTVAKTVLLVELLQRVHRTSATLTGAAYDADLDALAAATADGAWRRERGIKLSWLRARALRKQAAALATDRRTRREDLHEALISAEIERRAWAALALLGTHPTVPADGALVERTAQTFDAINAGLHELARVLPEHDLDGLPFDELIDLVERLAADEGTLYRLPTIRSLRATLEEAGLGDLLAELAAAKADRRAAEAAYTARQALAGGQRDGLAEEAAAPAPVSEDVAEAPSAEAEAEAEPSVVSLPAPSPAADDLVAAAAAALVEAEDAPAEAEESEAAVEVIAEVEVAAEAAVEVPEAVEVEVPAEVVEEAAVEGEAVELEVAEVEVAAEAAVEVPEAVEVEVPAEVVEETAVEAAADELAEAEPAGEADAEAAETEAVVGEIAEVEAPADLAGPEAVAVVEPAAEAPAPVEEESGVAAEAVEADAPVAVEPEAVAPEVAVEDESTAHPTVEPTSEVEAPAEAPAEVTAETPEAVEATVAVEAEVTEEPEAAVEPAVEPAAEAPAPVEEESGVAAEAVEPEQPAETEQPAAPESAGRPAKPDFTPGRPVTAYSAEELLAVVRWVDGDGVERSDEELLRAAMKELGFGRLGPRIKEALGAAVTGARG
ncbi:hypothetical protein ACWCXH_15585 [Kitasatospora sp. NPDC001660]